MVNPDGLFEEEGVLAKEFWTPMVEAWEKEEKWLQLFGNFK